MEAWRQHPHSICNQPPAPNLSKVLPCINALVLLAQQGLTKRVCWVGATGNGAWGEQKK